MADGQKESAITNYRKSLELDPSNSKRGADDRAAAEP
jgi:hypothetical protein